jgi:hypothetical protein
MSADALPKKELYCPAAPPAGAADGAQGVPVTVISEYDHAPAALSRYCTVHYCLPLFTRAPQKLLEFLIDYARWQPRFRALLLHVEEHIGTRIPLEEEELDELRSLARLRVIMARAAMAA